MLPLQIKKAVKLPVLLLIINFLLLPCCYSQKSAFKDSAALKADLDKLLKKYGLKSIGFAINVISNNQKGGQTAYSITNNYKIISNEKELSPIEKADFIVSLKNTLRDNKIKCVSYFYGLGSNIGKYSNQIKDAIKEEGISVEAEGTTFYSVKGVEYRIERNCLSIYFGTVY